MINDDTIVAVATPLGQGGLGVVRMSGSDALRIADLLFSTTAPLSQAITHTLHHGWIKANHAVIDEAVAAVFHKPRSYTGENVIEFSCHGSPAVLKEVVALCVRHGARPAEPGEFTQRAYLNGKLDLAQAEAVSDLIHATSHRARSAATDQLRGALSVRLKVIRDRLIALLAKIEANLDFSEEGTPYVDREQAGVELNGVMADLDSLLSTSLRGRLYRDGLRVAIVGRPNVGKSSLFNALLASDRAIVTPIPGTTRDTLEEIIEWDGYTIRLIDTAGLRHTTDEVERIGTERARRAQENADVTLLILDGSEPLTEEDRQLMDSFSSSSIIVINKSDRPTVHAGLTGVSVSAKTGAGLEQLKSAVIEKIPKHVHESENTAVVTNVRHLFHLENVQTELKQAISSLEQKRSEEVIAMSLRAALVQLGMITGESVTEDVLSSIFSQFCIGK